LIFQKIFKFYLNIFFLKNKKKKKKFSHFQFIKNYSTNLFFLNKKQKFSKILDKNLIQKNQLLNLFTFGNATRNLPPYEIHLPNQ